jgi:hypothetical protein
MSLSNVRSLDEVEVEVVVVVAGLLPRIDEDNEERVWRSERALSICIHRTRSNTRVTSSENWASHICRLFEEAEDSDGRWNWKREESGADEDRRREEEGLKSRRSSEFFSFLFWIIE